MRTAGWTRGGIVRPAFLVLMAAFFLLPQLAMARFAFQNVPMVLLSPDRIFDRWEIQPFIDALQEPGFRGAALTSLKLSVLAALLNLALLLPLAIAVEIRAPHLKGMLTAITLLPWVIPPIALVVGVSATFRSVAPFFVTSAYGLVPFYALIAMPFTYRALDSGLRAIGAKTLHEAGRSLGASQTTMLFRVLIPNLGTAIVASSVLTGALVLGEFAFASLLLKETLPTFLATFQRNNARAGMALALAVMLLTALALALAARLIRRRGLDLQTTGL